MRESEASASNASLGASLARFVLVLGALWVVLALVARALPYVRPGFQQIYADKVHFVESEQVFRPEPPLRVTICGNSRVLAGFRPALFDELSGGRVQSYNLGLPNRIEFVDALASMAERGQAPTHVLLTLAWRDTRPEGWRDRLRDDDWLMDRLFPFRTLPRDLVLFGIRSMPHGGPLRYYEYVKSNLASAREHRGYYFIASQSHFPGDRLPPDFRLDTDTPERPFLRTARAEGERFERLTALAREHGIRLLFVPFYFREGEFAPAPTTSPVAEEVAPHGIEVVGPDYWLLPNRLFADAAHLNPEGAAHYTTRLWELLASRLAGGVAEAAGEAPVHGGGRS